jgi:hypothetical protein
LLLLFGGEAAALNLFRKFKFSRLIGEMESVEFTQSPVDLLRRNIRLKPVLKTDAVNRRTRVDDVLNVPHEVVPVLFVRAKAGPGHHAVFIVIQLHFRPIVFFAQNTRQLEPLHESISGNTASTAQSAGPR